MRAVALVLILALAGCLRPGTDAPGCDAPAVATTGSRLVHVEIANSRPEDACLRLFIDGVLVASKELPGETPGLHANPSPAGDVRTAEESVLVRVEDATTRAGYEERVTLGAETWVAAWLGEKGGNVETYDRQPMWM